MYLTFNTQLKFYEYLQSLDKDIDINKSLQLCYRGAPKFLAYKEKGIKSFQSTVALLTYLNDKYDTNIDVLKSSFSMTTTFIAFKTEEDEVIKMELDEVVETVVEDTVEEKVEETSKVIDKVLVTSFSELKTKEAKNALAEYALREFEVKLKKNTTFEKMLETLENSL